MYSLATTTRYQFGCFIYMLTNCELAEHVVGSLMQCSVLNPYRNRVNHIWRALLISISRRQPQPAFFKPPTPPGNERIISTAQQEDALHSGCYLA